MRIVLMGSGAFGLPTFRRLAADHEIPLVVTQPDRPAGRRRRETPTPVGAWADEAGLPLLKPERLDPGAVARVLAAEADAHVVIAYGHKVPPALVDPVLSVNLHASLLPRWRGAAPINHAMMAGDPDSGVSVIALAERMDAGAVHGRTATPIDPRETAGELHDRLAELGPGLMAEVLAASAAGRLPADVQDETLVTLAPKLSAADRHLDLGSDARSLRGRIHGLVPWPGCPVRIDGHEVKLLRVADEPADDASAAAPPGTLLADGTMATGRGRLRLLEVQPAGGRAMDFEAFCRGRAITAGATVESGTGGQ